MIDETVSYTEQNFKIESRTLKNFNMNSDHFHDFYEIYYMDNGSRNYFINDSTYPVKEGDLVLVKPQDLHKTFDTGDSHTRILINFRPKFFNCSTMNEIIDSCFLTSRIITTDYRTNEIIKDLLNQLIIEAKNKVPYYEISLESLLSQLLIILSRYLLEEQKSSILSNTSNEKVYEVIQYLKNNYTDNITLDELASKFYISRYYLTRLFKKNTGFTIFEYLHSLRVIEAQKLLLDKNMKVIEISEMVGYKNISSFGKSFKSITGISPLTYRKKHLKK